MSDEIFPRTEICRDGNYQSLQASSDWRMLPVAQLPLSMWDAAPQYLQTVSNAQAHPTIQPLTALQWVLPPIFPEDVKFPPPSELLGTPQMFEALVANLDTSSQQCSQGYGKSQMSEPYITFSGHMFDVEAMTFEFHEDKLEFENYDLIINLPGQESILTTESWAFFIDRLSPGPDNSDENDQSDTYFEFIEDKLEFEENDLAMSFPGQESILTGENFHLMCLKLEESEFAELKLRQYADMNGIIWTRASVTSCNGTCDGTIMENGEQATPAEPRKSTEVPEPPLPFQQDNGMNPRVKKRKNIFAGFVCAKIIKAFVSKFVIV